MGCHPTWQVHVGLRLVRRVAVLLCWHRGYDKAEVEMGARGFVSCLQWDRELLAWSVCIAGGLCCP
jgi:hypothetical protein